MIIDNKITVKNYKCFDSTGGGFDRIMPINLIIGKNNSGKSSLLDLVNFIIKRDEGFLELGRDGTKAEVFVEHTVTKDEIPKAFLQNYSGGGINGNHFEYGKQFIGKRLTYKLGKQGEKLFSSIDAEYVPDARGNFDSLAHILPKPFSEKTYCHISAERDIVPEKSQTSQISDNTNISLSPNGSGATKTIQDIINHVNKDSRLIEEELLDELNTIINPDIDFTRILVQLKSNESWEVFFENAREKRIALSKMGSGVKTILLVLLNLIVRPVIENREKSSYVFAFEELENNLHPSLQRRLYNYIRNYSEEHSAYFFLTTHSNVVIDAFGMCENAQIVHVVNDGDKATTTTIQAYRENEQILSDLGIKASDILQSNGVIWVEGPSDRN